MSPGLLPPAIRLTWIRRGIQAVHPGRRVKAVREAVERRAPGCCSWLPRRGINRMDVSACSLVRGLPTRG